MKTCSPALLDSAQLVTWSVGITLPSARTRSLTTVPMHKLAGSRPFCTDKWRRHPLDYGATPARVDTERVSLARGVADLHLFGRLSGRIRYDLPGARVTGAGPLALTWASAKSASGPVTRPMSTIITRTAATSLPAGPMTNCRTFPNPARIADLKVTTFSDSGMTAPRFPLVAPYAPCDPNTRIKKIVIFPGRDFTPLGPGAAKSGSGWSDRVHISLQRDRTLYRYWNQAPPALYYRMKTYPRFGASMRFDATFCIRGSCTGKT